MSSRSALTLGSAVLLAAASACGSSGGNGTMNVHLVDAPASYEAITLHVKSVEIFSQGTGWITLGTPDKSVDLLSLTNGIEELLVNGSSLPAGTYGQMRLLLGSGNTVTLTEGGAPQPLKVPSGMQSGVKLPVHFEVAPGTTKDVFIDFDAHRSIFLHQAGHSGQYILRPVVRALDRVVTGSVSGKLTDTLTGLGLPGVTVMAETIDAAGNPSVVSSAFTGPDGAYTLGLLPIDATYYVVSQPVVGPAVYAPRSSAGLTLTATAPVASYQASFAAVEGWGQAVVSVSPVEDADDEVSAMQPLDAGGTPRLLVVRAQNAAVDEAGETATLDHLPAGDYVLAATRSTSDAEGTVSVKPSLVTFPPVVTVTADGVATASITFAP